MNNGLVKLHFLRCKDTMFLVTFQKTRHFAFKNNQKKGKNLDICQ